MDDLSTSLESMAAVVAGHGSIDYAPIPGGGAVLVGAATSEGDGVRFDPAGLILDEKGMPTVGFRLPQPTDVRSIAVAGDRGLVYGMACEGISREEDTGGDRECDPGNMVGFEVDLGDGVVTRADLPAEAVERFANADVIGVGGSGFLLTVQNGDQEFRSWTTFGDGRWRAIDAPPDHPCQVGDHAVVLSSMLQGEQEHQTAVVLDPESGKWSEPVMSDGPSVTDAVVQSMCSTERLVVLGGRPTPQEATLDTFDPVESSWRRFAPPDVPGGPVLEGRRGLHDVIVASMGVSLDAPAVVFDPVTGRSAPSEISYTGPADYLAVGDHAVLVIGTDGDLSVTEVDA